MIARNWRTSTVILACGGLMLTIALGVRHNFGLYLQPMTLDLGIGREAFAIAMWVLTIGMGVVAALLNLPIDERQIARPAPAPRAA